MITNNSPWLRVSRRKPCPVCNKPDWCLISDFDETPAAAICARIESPIRCGEAGWLHHLHDKGCQKWQSRPRVTYVETHSDTRSLRDWCRFANQCVASLATFQLEALSNELGVSVEALRQLRTGWSNEHHAFTFPMFNANDQVLGIRLRKRNGQKWSVRGGHEGLFVIHEEINDRAEQAADANSTLVICEGPTDTAALLDLGFDAVGRPSCKGGIKQIVDFVQSRKPCEVVIIADEDVPGLRGANNLASVLTVYVPSVKVVVPPDGANDARDWKRKGATHKDVLARFDEVSPLRFNIQAIKHETTLQRKAGKHECYRSKYCVRKGDSGS